MRTEGIELLLSRNIIGQMNDFHVLCRVIFHAFYLDFPFSFFDNRIKSNSTVVVPLLVFHVNEVFYQLLQFGHGLFYFFSAPLTIVSQLEASIKPPVKVRWGKTFCLANDE
jgi:hypothetical protein